MSVLQPFKFAVYLQRRIVVMFLNILGFYSDEDGQYVGNIYSSESWDAYLDREMCIIEQYSEYDVPFTNDTKVKMFLTNCKVVSEQ